MKLVLLVLRCRDLTKSKAFYEALGLSFRAEKHGDGPDHWSCSIGDTVVELYPLKEGAPAPSERLGFQGAKVDPEAIGWAGGRVVNPALLIDPDGRKVEV